jgi:uncharacterized protein YcnI
MMTSFRARRGVRAGAAGLVLAAGLVWAPAALAHAEISPPVAKAGVTQQFTLAVPTEKEGATTTAVELTVPDGVAIDSFEPEPGWTRHVSKTGSGESAVVQRVTWTGGHVPTDEDAVFRFLGTLTGGDREYAFQVRQTYSDGSVVNWAGPESSDTPSPVVDGSSLSGGPSTLLVVAALVVGGAGVLIGLLGLVAGRRPLT